MLIWLFNNKRVTAYGEVSFLAFRYWKQLWLGPSLSSQEIHLWFFYLRQHFIVYLPDLVSKKSPAPWQEDIEKKLSSLQKKYTGEHRSRNLLLPSTVGTKDVKVGDNGLATRMLPIFKWVIPILVATSKAHVPPSHLQLRLPFVFQILSSKASSFSQKAGICLFTVIAKSFLALWAWMKLSLQAWPRTRKFTVSPPM